MLNQVQLIGRLGAAPEVRRLNSGDPVCNLRIATDETWRDKQTGEKREKTEWHQVVIFNERLVNFVERFAKKGTTVFVQGQIQTRKWQDQQSNDRYSTEIVLQKFKGEIKIVEGWANDDATPSHDTHPHPDQAGREDFRKAELDDEIPF